MYSACRGTLNQQVTFSRSTLAAFWQTFHVCHNTHIGQCSGIVIAVFRGIKVRSECDGVFILSRF